MVTRKSNLIPHLAKYTVYHVRLKFGGREEISTNFTISRLSPLGEGQILHFKNLT